MGMKDLVTWDANNIETEYYLGRKSPLEIALDTNAACYPGDGAAAAAYFAPPYIAYYQLSATVSIRKAPGYESHWEVRNAYIALEDLTTHKIYIISENILTSPFNSAGLVNNAYIATMHFSGMHLMNIGHHYGVKVYLHARSDAISQHFAIGAVAVPGGYDAYTAFEGFEVHRL
jgi:hypothetical protein